MRTSWQKTHQPARSLLPVPDASDCVCSTPSALENEPGRAHIRGMEKYRSSMLEVSVTHHPPQWEWWVTFNGVMVANGFEREQIAAKFEGYHAMFLLLAAGWNP